MHAVRFLIALLATALYFQANTEVTINKPRQTGGNVPLFGVASGGIVPLFGVASNSPHTQHCSTELSSHLLEQRKTDSAQITPGPCVLLVFLQNDSTHLPSMGNSLPRLWVLLSLFEAPSCSFLLVLGLHFRKSDYR